MQLAGMALYLDIDNYLFLAVTHDEQLGRCITVLQAQKGDFQIVTDPIAIHSQDITLQVTVNGLTGTLTFTDGEQQITVLDNVALDFLSGGFTGNFIALDTIDMGQYNRAKAQFKSFHYQPK
jgi:xylan 1,4-beta-xylosidase